MKVHDCNLGHPRDLTLVDLEKATRSHGRAIPICCADHVNGALRVLYDRDAGALALFCDQHGDDPVFCIAVRIAATPPS